MSDPISGWEKRSQPNLVVDGLRFTPTLRREFMSYFHTISEYSTERVWTESIEALYGDGLRRFAKGEKP